MPAQGEPVRVAVWEPDGVDIGLFRHPDGACLVLAAAGIVAGANPFVELVAIRDKRLAVEDAAYSARIAAFRRAQRVKIVSMS